VLLVYDDGRNVFAIETILRGRNVNVLRADNGKVAVETLRNRRDVDAVLMDVMMPEMDGLEATRVLRGIAEFRSLPIISLTAKAMKGDREKALAAGANDYIAKPVDPDRLLAVLHFWINRNHRPGTAGANGVERAAP
jgi:CheY-like chemotaxis protein